MNFDDWMLHKGLSKSSAAKYAGAVHGVLSQWAIENGIIEGPISSITSHTLFQSVSQKIATLPIYIERNERGHYMYSSALAQYSRYLSEGFENDVEADIQNIIADSTISETEKSSLVTSRIGQGTFRQKLIGYWGSCAVTKYKDTSLLIASHIKPWRASSNQERLDVFNGLLLTPNLDRAFDSGLITFDEHGHVKISAQLVEPEKLGITSSLCVDLAAEHKKYMSFHREFVFKKN